MRSGTSLYSFCLAVVLGLASAAHAATYNVTLLEGPDQPGTGDYTLAGAVAAANLDAEPAEVLIHLPYVWLDAPLALENMMTIAPAEGVSRAEIYPRDGAQTAFVVGAEGRGSLLKSLWFFYQGTSTESTAVGLCDTELTMENVSIHGFGKALNLQCGAVWLTVHNARFGGNDVALSGLLDSWSFLTLTNILDGAGGGVFLGLQAPECGGQLVVDDLWWLIRDSVEAESTINLAGCVDLTIRNGRFGFGSVFLRANPLPSADNSLLPVVRFDQVSVSGYVTGNKPLIQFDGGLLALRHSTLARNRGDADNCVMMAGGDIHLYHSVIAGNQCQAIELMGSADLQYSLIEPEWLGGDLNSDATSLALLGQTASFEEGLIPAPTPDSPLRDAGDPALLPGVGGTPLTDARGSARLTGAALDIGAAEFNQLPVLDEEAFLSHRREQLLGREPDEVVVLNLRDYFSDPDGHAFEILEVVACLRDRFDSECLRPPEPFYDPVTGTISATAEILRRRAELIIPLEDELGLNGGILIFIPREGGDSGGGSAAGLLVLLVLLGRRRRAL